MSKDGTQHDGGWIEIARTGTFTDSSGMAVTFDAARLDQLVESFDPALRRVPLVIGHPQTEAPAFGWLEALQRRGERLWARFAQVPEQVRELVRAGRYKNVSMGLGPDGRLWHVGLLGARQPAIDGLEPVALAGGDAPRTIVFAVPEGNPEGGPETHKEEAVNEEALKKENEELKARLASVEAELAKAQAELEERSKEFAAREAKRVEAGRVARVERLVNEAKLLPKDKDKVLRRAALLAAGQAEVLAFSAADGSTERITPEEEYWRELEGAEPHGLLREFATPERAGDAAGSPAPGGNLAGKF